MRHHYTRKCDYITQQKNTLLRTRVARLTRSTFILHKSLHSLKEGVTSCVYMSMNTLHKPGVAATNTFTRSSHKTSQSGSHEHIHEVKPQDKPGVAAMNTFTRSSHKTSQEWPG